MGKRFDAEAIRLCQEQRNYIDAAKVLTDLGYDGENGGPPTSGWISYKMRQHGIRRKKQYKTRSTKEFNKRGMSPASLANLEKSPFRNRTAPRQVVTAALTTQVETTKLLDEVTDVVTSNLPNHLKEKLLRQLTGR